MLNIRLTKFLFFNKTKISIIDPALLRYYEQIISGFWAILILMPLEQYLDHLFAIEDIRLSLFSVQYLILLIIGTIFFIITSALVPVTRKMHTRLELQSLFNNKLIDGKQKSLMRSVLQNNMLCKNITTKEGLYQFTMTNLFNFGVLCAYYAFENTLYVLFKKEPNSSLVTASIFMLMFLLIIFIEKKIDKTMYNIMIDDPYHNDDKLYGDAKNNKKILIQTMKLVASETFYERLSYSVLEDSLDDIIEILHISSNKDN